MARWLTVLALPLLAFGCHPAEPETPPRVPPPILVTAPPQDTPTTPMTSRLDYPKTRVGTDTEVLHGLTIRDPYRWLEDEKSPEVQAWMTAQNDLARAELAKLPERDAIAARLKQLYYLDVLSAPRHRKGRYFFTRRHADKEKSIVYWRESETAPEKVLFDPNTWSSDGSTSLGGWDTTFDGQRVAYKVHQNNSDEATLYVMDVASGKKSEIDVIEGAKYASAQWTPKGDGFFYVWLPTDAKLPASERPGYAEVRFHTLGKSPKDDVVWHEKTGDASTFLDPSLSRDGRFLLLNVHHGWSQSDAYFKEVKDGVKAPWRLLAKKEGAHYYLSSFGGKLYVQTDEGAPRGRVFQVDPKKPERTSWRELVPEHATASLVSSSILGGKLVLSYLKDAASLVEIRDLDGKLVRNLALPGIGTVNGPIGLEDEDQAYFAYDSFTTPLEIYGTSLQSGKTDLYSKVTVPVDPSRFIVEQVFFTSKDKTRVSMFVIRPKDLVKDGKARTILYGYGGFQISQTPEFTASIFPWLERGGVYVVANLRGGGEYGEAWHKAGMGANKQNVFDDYFAAAEHLIREGYTSPSKLVARGGSNGGLLVGAALTQRPDLFRAGLCAVPLLDMVRYHQFGSGRTWISEYGSSEDPEQAKTLFAYSPYHHTANGTRYPALLLLSADSDDRVDPMHARKFAAAMQAASTGGPVLLRIERNSGHGGADLIKASVEKGADEYAFALAMTADR
jgi:prolyl oligopeptidase